jgi:TetR/AcrR family fatty acid metabolism transcriptional regulator
MRTERWHRMARNPSKTRQQVLSEFRRTEIVDAARTVFARRGFTNGIVDEIAKEAGIAKGTVYLYFRSKTEIYKAVLAHDLEFLKRNTLSQVDAANTLRDKIGAFVRGRLENVEAKKEFFRIMDTETASMLLTRKQHREWLREPVSRLASAIAEASKRNEIRTVPAEKVAWMIDDLTRGAIQRRLQGQENALPAEDAEFISNFIWASLAVEVHR